MNAGNRHTLPLQELFGILNSNGYALTIEQILQIETLLLAAPLSKIPTSELKYVLTPVIAKNPEEQQDVYDLIDNWLAETTATNSKPTRLQRWLNKNRTLLFVSKILAVLLVLAVAVWLYLRTTGERAVKPNQATAAAAVKDTGVQPAATSDAAKAAMPLDSVDKPGKSIKAVADTGVQVRYSVKMEQPVAPAIIDNRLPFALIFGFVAGAILFHFVSYEKRKRMELDKRKRTEDAMFTLPANDQRANYTYLYNDVQQLQQMDLQFGNKEYLIHRPARLQKIKVMLQQPYFVEDPPIDIRGSIRQSILAAGMATVVKESEWKERKFLFICERPDPEAHITCLLNYVVRYITATNPNISKYYYTNDVMRLTDVSGRPITLQQLAYLFPAHEVIVIGGCQAFFDAESLRLKEPVAEQFVQWESRSVITPVPVADWSANEGQLKDAGFRVAPADMEGIESLTSAITTGSLSAKRLMQASSVARYDLHDTDQLQTYLNDERLFQAVCALAVYPFLRWPVTLALFHALEKEWPGFVLNYETLLKVCRIPWVNQGHIDEPVRLQLLNALDVKTERLARETILKLLDETKLHTEQGTSAYTELQMQYNINAFFLYSSDQLQYKQYAGVKEVIAYYWNNLDDWALKEHMKQRQSGMVPGSQARAATSVEEFVVKEQLYEKLNFRLKQSGVLVLPSALLFIVLTITKPGLVYMEDITQKTEMAVIVHKDGLCQRQLAVATVSNGILTASKQLDPDNLIDTVKIAGVPYNSFLNIQLTDIRGRPYSTDIPANHNVCHLTANCQMRR